MNMLRHIHLAKVVNHVPSQFVNHVALDTSPSPTATEAPYEKDRPVVMVYSSGTTGASKGIVLTNDGINATIAHYQNPDFPYKRGNTFFDIAPLFLSTGIVICLLMPLCLGISVLLMPEFSAESFSMGIISSKPSIIISTISHWIYAIHSEQLINADLSSMIYPITGGEQVLPAVENEVNDFLSTHNCPAKLIKGWGMCELGSTITSTSKKHSKPGSAGYPILGVTVAAFDMETNNELPYGERGELRVCSPAHMQGYYLNQAATQEFFRKDKNGTLWGCTGDIGYVDEDGDVFVLGRATDCYYTADGTRIFNFDAENVLLRDEAVALCKVVGINLGGKTVPVAHIVMKEESMEPVKAVIQRLNMSCRMSLTGDAIPRYYKVRDVFPVHPNGKRDAEALRQERDGFLNTHGEAVAL